MNNNIFQGNKTMYLTIVTKIIDRYIVLQDYTYLDILVRVIDRYMYLSIILK